MAFIRLYKPSDFEAASHICRATLPPSLASSAAATRLAPYVWTHQYTHLSPGTSFVLDDGAGKAVGYCIGCADVAGFAAGYGSYVAGVLDGSSEVRGLEELAGGKGEEGEEETEARMTRWAYRVEESLLGGNGDVLGEGYASTMHIDILPAYQNRGWGSKLIARFVESVKEKNPRSRGVWIGVAEDNEKVVPFYERVGFRRAEGGRGCIRMIYDF